MNLILMSTAACFYALAALENRVGIDADELKVTCLKNCSDKPQTCLEQVQKMSEHVERARRQNWHSALLGALILCIPVYHKVDIITFAVVATIVVASLQNYRAYHLEDELFLVLQKYLNSDMLR